MTYPGGGISIVGIIWGIMFGGGMPAVNANTLLFQNNIEKQLIEWKMVTYVYFSPDLVIYKFLLFKLYNDGSNVLILLLFCIIG